MKKVLVPVVVVAVIAGSYIAYPYYCVNRLGAAMQSDDQAQLTKLVDWSSVRGGLKADLIALMSESVAQPAAYNPGRALGQAVIEMIGPKVVDNIVASYATPAGLSGLIRNGGEIDMKAAVARTAASMAGGMALGSAGELSPAGAQASDVSGETGGSDDAMADNTASVSPIAVKSMRFLGLNEMEVAFQDPADAAKPSVKGILTREGLRWKLTRIMLPADEIRDAPQTAERPAKAAPVSGTNGAGAADDMNDGVSKGGVSKGAVDTNGASGTDSGSAAAQ